MFVEKCDWISATNEGPPDVQLQVDVVIDMLGEDIETERPVDRLELLVVVVIAELHPFSATLLAISLTRSAHSMIASSLSQVPSPL